MDVLFVLVTDESIMKKNDIADYVKSPEVKDQSMQFNYQIPVNG